MTMTANWSVLRFSPSEPAPRARYDRLFAQCDHAFIQQSSLWAEVIEHQGRDRAILLLALRDGEPVAGLPLYLYEHPGGNILTSVPYPGPLGGIFHPRHLSADDRHAAFRELLDAAERTAQECGCITLTLITDPLAPDPLITDPTRDDPAGDDPTGDDLPLYERFLAPTHRFDNFTQIVRVRDTLDGQGGIRIAGKRDIRENLAHAHRAGVRVVEATTATEFENWYWIHCKRHREIGVEPLPHAFLHDVWRRLAPTDNAFLLLATLDGEIASGCLYVRHRRVCDVLMMSADSDHRAARPNHALTEGVLLRLADSGGELLNWQSSASRSSGVYQFKARWGSREHGYHFLTKAYADLSPLLARGPARVAADYAYHYAFPFGLFDAPTESHFAKP